MKNPIYGIFRTVKTIYAKCPVVQDKCRDWILVEEVFFAFGFLYTVGTANADFDKNMLLLKNLQFSSNHYETLTQ